MSRVALWLGLLVAACEPDEPLVEDCDCADPDCSGPACTESCVDGRDNDGDLLADCLDPHCDGACLESCHDGRDNDGDTLLDCADGECLGASVESCSGLVDDDCDGKIDCVDPECDGDCPEQCTDMRDNDGDGAIDCADVDCDGTPTCHEVCLDGRDNDLDGLTDCSDHECAETCDVDEDGYLTDAGGGDDCDDTSGAVHPGADEVCNVGVDDDCNGIADDEDPGVDSGSMFPMFTDGDGDGFGGQYAGNACAPSVGTAALGGDCDDSNPDAHPDAVEVCGTPDDDCDGFVDNDDPSLDPSTGTAFYEDVDGDGHGDASSVIFACTQPQGYAAVGDDCHLFDPEIWQDTEWWLDNDDDGYGAGNPTWSCAGPVDHAHQAGDCDDADPAIHPGALGNWPSLVGAWQGNGDTADASGLGTAGVLVDDAAFVPGIYGEAFTFDGAGDRMEVALLASGPFTLSLWVKADLLPQPSAGVLSSSDTDATPDSFELRIVDPDALQLHSNLTDAASGLVTLDWTHVAVAFDGTSLQTWTAGLPQATEAWVADLPPSFVVLRLGSDRTGTFDFAGAVDDVLLFDHALSDAEVGALADGTASCLGL